MFGPVKDYNCACENKSTRDKKDQKLCPICGVSYTLSSVRRYNLGYIQLTTAIAHVWYLKGRPSFISIFLNLSKKKVESIIYCTENLSTNLFPIEFEEFKTKSNLIYFQEISSLKYRDFEQFYKKNIYRINTNFIKKKKSLNFKNLGFEKKNKKKIKYFLKRYRYHNKVNIDIFSYEYFNSPLFLLDFKYFELKKYKNQKSIKLKRLKFIQKKDLKGKYLNLKFSKKKEKKSFINKCLHRLYFDFFDIYEIDNDKNINSLFSSISMVSKTFEWNLKWKFIIYYLSKFPTFNEKSNLFYKFNKINKNIIQPSYFFSLNGAQIFLKWFKELNQVIDEKSPFQLLEEQIQIEMNTLGEPLTDFEFIQKIKLYRRFKLLRNFRRSENHPAWMILSAIPVLPPDLRPIIKLSNSQIAVSDLNKLYQKVIFRNNRIEKLKKYNHFNCLNSEEFQYSQRLLQESVDALLENGKGGAIPVCSSNQRPLKSLSDLLKGKKGRFRQNLLGKRVDYSGRSVIVVGPLLKIYECGLPKEIAIELFQPFLIKKLIKNKYVKNIVIAKRILQDPPNFVWKILKNIVNNHPILLNRAPTLHRFGIQAFKPQLVDGRAILLHPLVCSAFNADFDGDQMAIHLPLCFEARAESWKIAWSHNNLLSPAAGQLVCSPSQDIVLGCYSLTMMSMHQDYFSLFKKLNIMNKDQLFIKKNNIMKYYWNKNIDFFNNRNMELLSDHIFGNFELDLNIYTPIWLTILSNDCKIETDQKYQNLIELRISYNGIVSKLRKQLYSQYDNKNIEIIRKVYTTYGRILFNQNIINIMK
uniref:DNA-directed RNA polymerase subunit n=1 Tax=Dichotomosiphon tuberosus TaxID=118263 RepID=A0A386AWN5_9CHLO|nr:RNA polymerase b-subunit [Dichotomosiphon tuberosus]